MRILVDANIPLAEELFGALGDVTLAPGREVTADFPGLDGFDILAIRSVTKVNGALLDRAAGLRLLATATIGTDHIDLDAVREAGRRRRQPITVISAPGSNAESVADHIWYALAYLTRDARAPFAGMTLGIVGHGNCGSRVARRAAGFGMKVLRHDPPLAEREPDFSSDPLDDVLAADFVTLHVPLTKADESENPTFHMIGTAELARMRLRAYLLNSSRGAVVDSAALIKALKTGAIAGAVLDVYEGEPEPVPELISLPVLATPHIAGYAVEAKRRGATAIYEQICSVLGVEPQDTRPLLMRGFDPRKGVEVRFGSDGPLTSGERPADRALLADDAVRRLLAAVHDVAAVSRELKATLSLERRGKVFDKMRRDYESEYARHELACYRVGCDDTVGPELRAEIEKRLAGFGIVITEDSPDYVLTLR
jgi:erythronate-4-phosphate dehydrogenase